MSAEEHERLWALLRRLHDSLTQHLDESQERQQQTSAQLAHLRSDLLEHRAAQAEAQLRQSEAVRSLAVRTGTVSAIGAGGLAALLPVMQSLLHAAGWM